KERGCGDRGPVALLAPKPRSAPKLTQVGGQMAPPCPIQPRMNALVTAAQPERALTGCLSGRMDTPGVNPRPATSCVAAELGRAINCEARTTMLATSMNEARHPDERRIARRRKVLRRLSVALLGALVLTAAIPAIEAMARSGPQSVAPLAEKLIDAVVNISTSQSVKGKQSGVPLPSVPKGSPFEQFFEDFFNRKGNSDDQRKVSSLGSGFIIDGREGLIVTNNHVIEG